MEVADFLETYTKHWMISKKLIHTDLKNFKDNMMLSFVNTQYTLFGGDGRL